MTDFTLQGKSVKLNNFNTDILIDAIDESWLYYKDTRDSNAEPYKTKMYNTKNGLSGRTAFTIIFHCKIISVVYPCRVSS